LQRHHKWITIGFAFGTFIVIIYEVIHVIIENKRSNKKSKRDNEIKLIAYRIWEKEGCQNGCDKRHWGEAEAIWEDLKQKKN
jgi:hypothetical protein